MSDSLSPKSQAFTTREFRAGDEEAILDLFARCFHHLRSSAHFDWKYRRDPFGAEHISVSFAPDGRLAGHYAGYPVPFFDDGEKLIAHQIGDTMTDPAFRQVGRGPTSVLARTAGHFFGAFCESRIAFNYGVNVSNIQRFSHLFLRLVRVSPVSFRVRDLETHPLSPVARIERYRGAWSLEIVSAVSREYDNFFLRVAYRYGFLVWRDATYLRWRYLECPDASYVFAAIRKWGRLVGWSVFRINGGVMFWGDALFDPRWPDAPSILLRYVVCRFPVVRIESWFPPHPPWFAAVLDELSFKRAVEPQDLAVGCVPFTCGDVVARLQSSLYYTKGDFDLF